MAERPFLAAAFLCEKVLIEKDEVPTAVRIIDTIYVSIPANLPAGAKPVIQLTVFVSFKKASPGVEPERHQAALRLRSPSGREHPPLPANDFFFKAAELAGANLIVNMSLAVEEFGLFWLDISVDDQLMTQVPFRLLEKSANPPETIH